MHKPPNLKEEIACDAAPNCDRGGGSSCYFKDRDTVGGLLFNPSLHSSLCTLLDHVSTNGAALFPHFSLCTFLDLRSPPSSKRVPLVAVGFLILVVASKKRVKLFVVVFCFDWINQASSPEVNSNGIECGEDGMPLPTKGVHSCGLMTYCSMVVSSY
jgi:hypothetical protein